LKFLFKVVRFAFQNSYKFYGLHKFFVLLIDRLALNPKVSKVHTNPIKLKLILGNLSSNLFQPIK
jgi:hypothetical protein